MLRVDLGSAISLGPNPNNSALVYFNDLHATSLTSINYPGMAYFVSLLTKTASLAFSNSQMIFFFTLPKSFFYVLTLCDVSAGIKQIIALAKI